MTLLILVPPRHRLAKHVNTEKVGAADRKL
jgi:hypothetical protein